MIITKNGDLYIIYIYKSHDIDIFNYDDISFLLKKVFNKLKTKYNLKGLCNVDIYLNDEYGMIMEIKNIDRDLEYFDIKVCFHLDSLFLNEIAYTYNNDYDEIYYYNDKYYTIYNKNIDSNVIYKDVLTIINKGIKIK
ncbi:MAG: hypothetical protein IJI49_04600 [Bacilli bacterium]|nr:hypothetical protein [Bacilli bacterium]